MRKSERYGKYRGIEYKIIRDMDNNVEIMTTDKGKTDETFEDTYNSGLYTKKVNPHDLEDCIRIVLHGLIDGERVRILKEKQSQYQIETRNLFIGSHLNIPRIDRDTWLGWVSKDEVKLVEEKSSINPEDL
ncbi:MAG: hypothetical protein ACE3JK_07990 [Sporolactobacillus sp.]